MTPLRAVSKTKQKKRFAGPYHCLNAFTTITILHTTGFCLNYIFAIKLFLISRCNLWPVSSNNHNSQHAVKQSAIFSEPGLSATMCQACCMGADLFLSFAYRVERPLVWCLYQAQQFRPPPKTHTHTKWKLTDKMFAAESHLLPHCQHKHVHMTKTHKAVMLIQGSAGYVLTQASLSLTFTNLSSRRKPLRYIQMEFYTVRFKSKLSRDSSTLTQDRQT